jgi:hypothetical protein
MSEHTQTHTAHNPGHVDQAHNIKSTVPPLVTEKEFRFSFKKQMIKDELGEEIKRPSLTLTVPVPTFDGLISSLQEDPKVISFILDLAEEAIKDQVREQLSDEANPVMSQGQLDINKLTLSYIANLPKAERTGGGISKDTWAEWEKNYIEVMSPIRTADKATKAAKLMSGRYAAVRTDKQVLKFLKDQLAIWATNAGEQALEDYGDVYSYLTSRADDLLTKDNVSQLANL